MADLPLETPEDSSSKAPYMFHSRTFIDVGDLVIAFMTRDKMEPLIVTPGDILHNKFGKYSHTDMVGVKFGSRITSPAPNPGFIHLLRPTPELWTLSLPHRTQILYNADIAFIMQQLGVRKGGRVAEAGTGSGSMSHALARVVGGQEGGKGRVWSFEYHKTRFEKALEEFTTHGLLNNPITLQHRNVCKDGFGEIPGGVDSVFLDVPAPWEAVPHVVKILRDDTLTHICTFSPCLEQVQRTLSALTSAGFHSLSTHEVLTRAWEVANVAPVLDTVGAIRKKLREREGRKEERRMIQIWMAKERKRKGEKEVGREGMEVDEEEVVGAGEKRTREEEEGSAQAPPAKKVKLGTTAEEEEEAMLASAVPEDPEAHLPVFLRAPRPAPPAAAAAAPKGPAFPKFQFRRLNPSGYEDLSEEEEDEEDWVLQGGVQQTKPVPETRGHTSYLTFGVMYPKSVREEIEVLYPDREKGKEVEKNGNGVEEGKRVEREASYDTVGSGFDQAIATLSEEELMGMSMPAL